MLIWRVPAAPAGMPVAWRGHSYGRDGEAMGALALHELETIRVQSAQRDWSGAVVEGGWQMLDPAALARARVLYRRRHAAHAQALAALDQWDDRELMHHLRLARGGQLTKAALVLLGLPAAAGTLGGPRPRLTWVLHDHAAQIVAHRHFEMPLLTALDKLVACIRIIDVPLLPPGQLAPMNLPNDDRPSR